MRRLFSKIATLSVGLAMAVGVGIALSNNNAVPSHATEDETVTWTASAGSDLGSKIGSVNGTDSGTIQTGDFVWNYTRTLKSGEDFIGTSYSYIQLGKNGGVENVVFTTSQITGVIKSVTVNCASYNNAHNVAITVGDSTYLGKTSTPKWQNNTGANKTGTGSDTGAITISFTDGTRALYIKSISVTYTPGDIKVSELTTDPASSLTIDGEDLVTTKEATVSYNVSYVSDEGNGKVTCSVKKGGEATTELVATDNYPTKTITLKAKKNGTFTLTITTADKDAGGNKVSKELTIVVQNLVILEDPVKLTDPSTLKLGDKIYLVNETYNESIGGYDSSKKIFTTTDVVISEGKITDCGEAIPLVIGKYNSHLLLKYENGYIGAGNDKTTLTINGTGTLTWDIDMEADKSAVITSTDALHAGAIQYNYNNGNPRFSNYTTSQIKFAIYVSAATDQEVANEFMNNYMHMNDYNEDLGYCKDNSHNYYDFAKEAYKSMNATQRGLISAEALNRLAAWAKANGETFDPSEGTFTKLFVDSNIGVASANYAIIIIVATVSITALGVALMVLKKKKHN